jgi:parallel beta-helix repeat protein
MSDSTIMRRQALLLRGMIVLAFLLGTAVSSPVFSKDYYVDGNSGSAAGSGSLGNPCKTIAQAVNKASGADTIYVRYATYHESLSLMPIPKRNLSLIGIANGGNRPMIFSADPGSDAIKLNNHTGTIQGFEITGAYRANGINCIASDGGTNVARILDCVVQGNDIGIHVTTAGSMDTCSPFIHNNQIFSNKARGIGNMLYSSARIENNYIYRNGNGSEGEGGIGNRDYSSAQIIGNVIYNNYDNGIFVRDESSPEIVNNTISHHDGTSNLPSAISVRQNMAIPFLVIINNVIAENAYGLVSELGQRCAGNDYNNIYDNFSSDYVGFTKGSHDISANPLFVDPDHENFRLGPGSPCIDAASPDEAPDMDIDGGLRPQGNGYDMGAYEYTGEVAPLAPHLTITTMGTTLTLSWGQVADAQGYVVSYATPDLTYIGEVDLEDQTGFSIDLWNGATFYIAVQAYNGAGRSSYSNIEYFAIR